MTGPACHGHDPNLWFPTTEPGHPDNHGREAIGICARCPIREQCLTTAVSERIGHGIWGGAGEDERRLLRRAWTQDGFDNGPVWRLAVDRHFRNIDYTGQPVVNRNGPGAVCGKGVTYSRGCRCPACTLRAAWRGAAAKADKPDRRSRKRNVA